MNIKTTENGTRKFTREEKLRILKEAKQKGVKSTLEKYDLVLLLEEKTPRVW
jgi:hypothetical protein